MSDDDFSFALPAFKPDEALLKLKRELREAGLTEREGRFERRGTVIAKAVVDGALIQAGLVKRPSRSSPDWTLRPLKSAAEVRDFMADLKRKLAAWSDSDD